MSTPIEDGRRQIRSVRVDNDLVDWTLEQARLRGVGVSPIIEDALRLLREHTDTNS